MKISLFCFALFLSRVLCNRPMNVLVSKPHQCIVSVSESSIKLFNETLEKGKKVIFFRIHYNSKQADALTKPKADDHFANPNEYMLLYDGDNGLPVYMNAPYDFDVLSLFILREYTTIVTMNMTVSKSCNENNVTRVDFLRLVFHKLIQVVSPAPLPDKKTSAYICYDVNNRKNLPDYSFLAYKRLGMNRAVLHRYCCKVKNVEPNYSKTDLCPGEQISSTKSLDLQNYIGAFFFAFFPLAFGFISRAKLPWSHSKFAYIRSVSESFDKGEQFNLPSGEESRWINKHDDRYSIFTLLKWLFLFDRPSLLASRIRRSLAVFLFLLTIVLDSVAEYVFYFDRLRIYLDDNIPLGFKSLMFGYEKSAENTDYFLGGPLVWFSAFVFLGLIVINIPERLCQTIAKCTLDQQKSSTFLVQDIDLLQRYGSLNESNLYDYNLLYAILKSSLFTSLNPSFWWAIIMQWFGRCKIVYNYFNNSRIIYQLMGVCVIFPCVIVSLFLCACELLVCIVYYGCPQLVFWKSIPHSYTMCYISPLIRSQNLVFKTLGCMCFLMSLPIYIFLFLFSTLVFLTTFQLLSSYLVFPVIALIAKPDAIAYVLLTLVFFYFAVSVVKSVSETYTSLLKVSIKLADSVCKDFVYTRLDERFIRCDLFEHIVERHHPIRYEVGKALTKLVLALLFFTSCMYAFDDITFNISTYIKIGLLMLTSMIPKMTTVLKESVLESRWEIERILETIYKYKLKNSDRPANFERRYSFDRQDNSDIPNDAVLVDL